MEKDVRKQRDWIKNATIVFLVIMLILTFFSNTFMNYSLPEISAQYMESGQITAKVRGTGVIESTDLYEVVVDKTKKVSSVEVKMNQVVEKGDILASFEGEESEELKAAKQLMEENKAAYDNALIDSSITSSIISNANKDVQASEYRAKITALQTEIEKLKKDYDELQEKSNAFSTQIAITPSNNADTSKEKKAYEEAYKKYMAALANSEGKKVEFNNLTNRELELAAQIESKQKEIDARDAKMTELGDPSLDEYKKAQEEKAKLEEEKTKLTTEKDALPGKITSVSGEIGDLETITENYKANADSLKTVLEAKEATGNTQNTLDSLNSQKKIIDANRDAAKSAYEAKVAELESYVSNSSAALTLKSTSDKYVEAKLNYEKLLAEEGDSVLVAPVSGEIMEIDVVSGKKVEASTTAFKIQPTGKGYSLSVTVPAEQASKASIGDRADVVNSWRYENIDLVLSKIKVNPSNPNKEKLLIFDVTGDVVPGESLTVSVGQKSMPYDSIVPTSAIHEDSNGKFILTVKTKSSPLGNRYYASREDVTVLASDDNKSAVKGAFEGWEYVITTSTLPIKSGDLVRLANN